MTIKQEWFFDKAFVLDAINSCLNICKNQISYGFDGSDLFKNAFKLGLIRIRDYGHASGLLPHDLQDLEDQFYELNYQFQLKAHGLNDEVKQVSKPVPSNQLPVLSVLGQVTKARPVFQISKTAGGKTRITTRVTRLSPVWCPSVPVAAHLLFNPRSIGGLGQ